jgi:hypothetical protein
MRQRLEFVPPNGSTAKHVKPSVGKVRSLIDSLQRHGLVKLVEKGDKQRRKPAVFLCVLATCDLARLNEEQHENNTRTTRGQKSSNVLNLKAYTQVAQKSEKQEEQHSSVYSEQEDIYTREDLVFCKQFKAMSQQAMLVVSDAELNDYFDSFRFSTKDDGSVKPLGLHLKAWRQYCVSVRANLRRGDDNAKRSKFGRTAGDSFEESRRAAQQCREQGIDGSVLDEAIEAFDAIGGYAKAKV